MKINNCFYIILLSLLTAACSPPVQPPASPAADPAANVQPVETTPVEALEAIHITDALGREVILDAPPRRIAITGKALIMILDAAYMFPEAYSQIVAVGSAAQGSSNFVALIDPDFQEKALLQQDASAEQIAAVQPDLVILKSSLAETLGKPLDAVGIPVIFVDFETPDQYARDLQILGDVFQNPERARELTAFYQNRLEEIQAVMASVTGKPRTLLLYYTDRDGTIAFNVPPMSWMQTRLVELAGGEPVWSSANPGQGWTKVSLEQIAAWDADQIMIVSYTDNSSEVVARLVTDPQWQALRAVKQGRLSAFPGDFYSWDQPDARWILGLAWLAKRLHPGHFTELDITHQARDFYQRLYGLDPAFFDGKILPKLTGDLP